MAVPQQTPTFEDLELLVKVSQLLTLHDLNLVMERVIDLTATAVGAQKASMFLVDGTEVDWDYIFTARDLDEIESIQVVETVLDEGLAGWVVRNKTGTIIQDTETDERWHVFPNDTRVVRSALCVPLVSNSRVMAVLTLDHPEPNRFSDYQLRLMEIITNQASVAIRNAQLFRHLLDKQRQLEVVLQSVPDMLVVTDPDSQILLMNGGAAAFLGLEHVEAGIGEALDTLIGDNDVMTQVISQLQALPVKLGTETSLDIRSDKEQRDYVVTAARWHESNKEMGNLVIIMHDVTTLRDLYRFKDEMLRIASHDLRSPLSNITGYSDMIVYDTPEGSHLHEYTAAIQRSVDRMSNLLEDLLKVRQIDEKGLNLESDTHIVDLVRPVLQGIELSARQKNITINEDIRVEEEQQGNVDPMLVRQAMENLASNAVKYTNDGGQVTIRTYIEDNRLYYEVEDTGIGIPEESMPHLFESFYRVNPKINVSIGGAGLGLSLVKSIVERHQGEVRVKSEVGKGSQFSFWLPI
jgi:PAS domain S-box-containing protein